MTGADISDPKEIVFYSPGIEVLSLEVLPKLPNPMVLMHGSTSAERVKAKFHILPDCPLGQHSLRLRTATMLGTLATFWVGSFPTIEEKETSRGQNDDIGKAQLIPLNSTVAGRIHEGNREDLDFYRVEMKKGQRLSVEVEALRLSMMAYGDLEHDLMAFILDAAGNEVARNDDNPLYVQDPVVTTIVPRDGPYYVEIKQQLFRSHPFGWYRAHIGTFVRPMVIYPAGGKSGETLHVQALSLDGSSLKQDVTLPAQTGNFDFFAGAENEHPPSPNTLRVSAYGNVLEQEPNDKAENATLVPALPAALNGIIQEPGDVDNFRFHAKKGERLWLRCYARALGSPLDAVIRIWRADKMEERPLLEADDSNLQQRDQFAYGGGIQKPEMLDPSTVFEVKEDADYVLSVGDTRGMGSPLHVYRIEIEAVRNSIFTFVYSNANDNFETNRQTGFIVPRGNAWTLNLSLGEGLGNAYKGDLKLEAIGLPVGVQMFAPTAKAGMKNVPVQFAAGPEVKPQCALIEIVAKAADGSPLDSGSQQAIAFVNHSGGHAWTATLLNRYALGITEAAPFEVELEQPGIALAQSAELALKIHLKRRESFNEAVDVNFDWLPPGISAESSVTIPVGGSDGIIHLHADQNSPSGDHHIALNATTTGGDYYSGVGRIRVSSHFIDLKVAQPYVTLNIQRAAVERGGHGQIVCEVKHHQPLPAPAVAELRRLPNGIKLMQPLPMIAPNDSQVSFNIEASSDALVGLYKDIICEVTVTDRGQTIRQQTGSGMLRIDPAKGK